MRHIPISPMGKLPEGFISSNDTARMLGIADSTLQTLRQQKKGPPFFVWNGWRAIYRRDDVIAYAEKVAAEAHNAADKLTKNARRDEAEARAASSRGVVRAESVGNPAEDHAAELRNRNATGAESLSDEDSKALAELAGKPSE